MIEAQIQALTEAILIAQSVAARYGDLPRVGIQSVIAALQQRIEELRA